MQSSNFKIQSSNPNGVVEREEIKAKPLGAKQLS
jgi:hypothetical protein